MEGCSSLAYLDISIHLQIVHDTITNNPSPLLPHYRHWDQKEIISNTHKQGLISFLYSTGPSRLPCPTILIMNTLNHDLYDPSSSICCVFFLALFHVELRRATCHMWRPYCVDSYFVALKALVVKVRYYMFHNITKNKIQQSFLILFHWMANFSVF